MNWALTRGSYNPRARQQAIASNFPTYRGRECRHCQGAERHTISGQCIKCYPGSTGTNGPSVGKAASGAIGRAGEAWTIYQREHSNVHPFHLWPRFLKGLDREAHAAAIASMVPPLPPTQSTARAVAGRLATWAEQNGVHEIERKVREAIAAGRD
jgi:hypothetical protein